MEVLPAPSKPARSRKNSDAGRSKKYLVADTGVKLGQRRLTEKQKQDFLRHYAGCGNLTQSALMVGSCDSTFRQLCDRDPAFNDAYEFAYERFKSRLEAEALRRGKDGWTEPVVQKGQVVHYECPTCRGFGRVIPPGDPRIILEVSDTERHYLPMCTACGGTGKGDVVYTFKADSKIFERVLTRHISAYRDHAEVDHKVSGGVLVIGAQPQSTEDYESTWAGRRAPSIDIPVVAPPPPALASDGEDVPAVEPCDRSTTAFPDPEPVRVERRQRSSNRTGSGAVIIRR